MKNLLLLISFILLKFTPCNLLAGEVVTNTRLEGSALTAVGAGMKVRYDKYVNLQYSATNPFSVINTSKGMIEFGLDETKKVFHATNLTSVLTVDYFTKDFSLASSSSQTQILTIDYFPDKAYNAQTFLKLDDVSYIEITSIDVKTYKDYGQPGQILVSNPTDLYLETSISTDESLAFDYSASLPISGKMGFNQLPNSTNPTDIELWWDYLPGAEEYEVEYIFIDNYDASSYSVAKNTNNINYDFEHDATRITTHNQYYKIPLVFEKGWIIFRVRGVGRSQTNNNVRLEGTWSNSGFASGVLANYVSNFPNQSFLIGSAHENDNINWESSKTFAESGKFGLGVDYQDGTLKSRQSVAKLNTEDKTIAQSSLYDWHGRPAISVLPTPFNDNYISYKRDLNKTTAGAQFDKNIFDNIANFSNACTPTALTMDPVNSTGAAKYYSPQNAGQDAQQGLVPDASGLPYVQVEYYPDQTGRIKRQSTPGNKHYLRSGKDLQFFYAQPTQEELVRLFGTEVGKYDEYEKQIEIDANGQKSVTYTDDEGRTIATGLLGASPSNLISLADATDPSTAQSYNTTLVNNDNDPSTFVLGLSNTFFASQNETHSITYDVTASQYTDACLPSMCLDCIYELEISVKDDCGQEVLDGDASTAGNQPVTKILGRYVPGGNPEFPTSCGSTAALEFSLSNPSPFSFVVPKDGTYHINKTLKLSDKPLQEYAEAFVQNNTCIRTLESFQEQHLANIDFSGCDMLDCAQCTTAVNSFIASLPANTLTSAQQADLLDKCQLKCNMQQDLCASREMLLLKDFKPGGYFGKYTIDTYGNPSSNNSLSIFNQSNTIQNTILGGTSSPNKWFANPPVSYSPYTTTDPSNPSGPAVSPDQLSMIDFIATHNNNYAKPWLKWHPEYCRLQFSCDELIRSINTYTTTLDNINSFDEACRLGYLFPVPSASSLSNAPDNTTCPGCSGVTNHYIPLVGYSGSSYLSTSQISTALSDITTQINNHTFTALNGSSVTKNLYQFAISMGEGADAGSTLFGAGCNKDKQWIFYKRLYIKYISDVLTQLELNFISSWSYANGGCNDKTNFSSLPGYVRIFSDPNVTTTGALSGFGNGTTSSGAAGTSATSFITQQCSTYCQSYVASWMNSLTASSSCAVTSADMPGVLAGLEAVCNAGCDTQDPFGASNSLNPVTISVHGVNQTVYNFQDVLNQFGYTFSGACNAFVISMPKPKGSSFSGAATTTPTLDACGCDAILAGHTAYTNGVTNSTIDACIQSEVEFFETALGINLPYLSSYICACEAANQGGSTYDFTRVDSTLLVTLAIPENLACKNCIPCASLLDTLGNSIFVNEFGNVSPYSLPHEVVENFFNNTLNMQNTFDEWVQFMQDCSFTPPQGWTSSSQFYQVNASQEIQDFIPLFNHLYSQNYFVPNTSGTQYVLTPANAPAFFNSTLWDNSTLIPSTPITANVLVSFVGGLTYQVTITSNATSPAYSLSFNINDIGNILHTPEHQIHFEEVYAFCESGLADSYSVKQFVIKLTDTNPSTLAVSTLYTNGGNSKYIAFSPQGNISMGIKTTCGPYLCSHSLNSDPLPPNDCITTLINNALNAAQTEYNTYVDQQVDEFLANYKNYCYNTVTDTTRRGFNLSEYHYTLYYYDRAGNLVHTVPPAGVTVIINATTIANAITYVNNGGTTSPVYPAHSLNSTAPGNNITSYISHNQYNTFDAPTYQVTPDGGETHYYYDHVGRLAVSQNAKQKAEETFSYSLYDKFGRITEVGVFKLNAGGSDVFNPSVLNNPSQWLTYLNAHNRQQVSQTYYDEYPIAGAAGLFNGVEPNLRNRVSATTYEQNFDGDVNTYDYGSYFSYDDHGNVTHIVQHNPPLHAYYAANEYKHLEYEYELASGNVTKVSYQKEYKDKWFHKYEYDADNRLHAVYTSDNDLVYQRDAKYFYYQHGPLARTEIGEKQVQATDYAFTIQGWIKGINSTILNENNDIGKDGAGGTAYMSAFADLHKDFARDAASYSVNYFAGDYNPIKSASQNFLADMTNLNSGSASGFKLSADAPDLYNGNISSLVTSIYDINTASADKGKVKPQVTGYRYDQLQRIKHMKAYSSLQIAAGGQHSEAIDLTNNQWYTPNSSTNYAGLYEMDFNYDKLGNIKNLVRKGNAQYTAGAWQAKSMDNLTYNYNTSSPLSASLDNKIYTSTNKLTQVQEDIAIPTGNFGDDIDADHNYTYNEIGSLKSDLAEEILEIQWNDNHKVKAVIRTSTSMKADLYFGYDALGHRVSKTVIPKSSPGVQNTALTKTTYYILDADGTNLGIYEYMPNSSSIKCVSRAIYGAARLGENSHELQMFGYTPTPTTAVIFGEKNYELTNHLGNVITTVSDRKIQENGADANANGVTDYYTANIITTTDYYAFGMAMPGRSYAVGGTKYRYGFNGKEKDDELLEAEGIYDFGERLYDARLGRFFSTDDLEADNPGYSPYAFANNNPIALIDEEGLSAAGPPWLEFVSAALDFVPIVGTIKNIAEAAIGYDLAGNKLSVSERLLMVIPGSALTKNVFKAAKGAVKFIAKHSDDIARVAGKIFKKVQKKVSKLVYGTSYAKLGKDFEKIKTKDIKDKFSKKPDRYHVEDQVEYITNEGLSGKTDAIVYDLKKGKLVKPRDIKTGQAPFSKQQKSLNQTGGILKFKTGKMKGKSVNIKPKQYKTKRYSAKKAGKVVRLRSKF